MRKVLYVHFKRVNPFIGRIFVKFDDPKAGNYGKDVMVRGELKGFVPITAETKSSLYGKETVSIGHSICNYYPYISM